MSITVNDGGVLRKLGTVTVNDGGVLKSLGVITANDGGTLRKIFTSWKERTLTWSNPSTSEVVLARNSGTIPECIGAYSTDINSQTLMGNWNDMDVGVKIDYDVESVSKSYGIIVTLNIGGNLEIGTISPNNNWHIKGSFVTASSTYFPAPLFLHSQGRSKFPELKVNFKFSKA